MTNRLRDFLIAISATLTTPPAYSLIPLFFSYYPFLAQWLCHQ